LSPSISERRFRSPPADAFRRPRIYAMAKTRDPHEEEATMTNSGEARVVVRTGDGLCTEIEACRHELVADEPTSVGGADAGPTPYDYLLAALGGCTAVTVRLSQERIHATDCEECETGEGRIDRLQREIELEGPLDEKQRQKLLEIADKCPVHRTMQTEALVKNVLVS